AVGGAATPDIRGAVHGRDGAVHAAQRALLVTERGAGLPAEQVAVALFALIDLQVAARVRRGVVAVGRVERAVDGAAQRAHVPAERLAALAAEAGSVAVLVALDHPVAAGLALLPLEDADVVAQHGFFGARTLVADQ